MKVHLCFETSCDRLLRNYSLLEMHCETDHEKQLFKQWIAKNETIHNYAANKQLELWDKEEEDDPELFPQSY